MSEIFLSKHPGSLILLEEPEVSDTIERLGCSQCRLSTIISCIIILYNSTQ